MKKWTVGLYARVSTDHDNQKLSNTHQIQLMRDWIKQQQSKEDINFYKEYIDDGISGTKIDKRLGFQKLIKDAKDGLINFIIVKSVTRFARNQVDSIRLAQELKEIGVRIYFHQESIDTLNNDQMLGLWAWLAENESRTTSQRRKDGGRSAQKNGRFTTNRPPLGYETYDGKLVTNKDESKIIEEIFDMFISGYGYGKIASTLNERGYKTRRGYEFRTDKVKYILNNPTYKGTFIGNRYTKPDMMSKKIIEKPQEEWIILDNNHDAIIEVEKFELVQKLINNKSFKMGKRSKALLAGIVKCQKCGHGYVRNISKKKNKDGVKEHIYYKCTGRTQKGKTFCDGESIKESVLIELVDMKLSQFKKDESLIEMLKQNYIQVIDDKIRKTEESNIDINSRIDEIEQQRKTLAKKNIMGVIDDDIFKSLDDDLKEELDNVSKNKQANTFIDLKEIINNKFNNFELELTKYTSIEGMSNIEMREIVDSILINDKDIEINLSIDLKDVM